ncbi:MAG: hypothetical protein CMO38_02925 [Verrucomicrobiaceae bacterium]|nr:hypothetical protein [Verrucomicrobiaceae bacterium]
MSLRRFHIVFISISTLCLLSFGIWCFYASSSIFENPQNGENLRRISGSLSLILALITLVYGIWFYFKKIKNLNTFEIT